MPPESFAAAAAAAAPDAIPAAAAASPPKQTNKSLSPLELGGACLDAARAMYFEYESAQLPWSALRLTEFLPVWFQLRYSDKVALLTRSKYLEQELHPREWFVRMARRDDAAMLVAVPDEVLPPLHLVVNTLLDEGAAKCIAVWSARRGWTGDWGSVALRKKAHNRDINFCDGARRGHAALLTLLLDHGLFVSTDTAVAAAEAGQLAVLKVLHERSLKTAAQRRPPAGWDDAAVVVAAASAGREECLRFALECGGRSAACVWDGKRAAARGGHANCLRVLFAAAAGGGVEPSNALLRLGCLAAARGHVDCLRLLVCELGAPAHSDMCLCAATNGALNCLAFLVNERGAAWNADACRISAASTGHGALVGDWIDEWLRRHRIQPPATASPPVQPPATYPYPPQQFMIMQAAPPQAALPAQQQQQQQQQYMSLPPAYARYDVRPPPVAPPVAAPVAPPAPSEPSETERRLTALLREQQDLVREVVRNRRLLLAPRDRRSPSHPRDRRYDDRRSRDDDHHRSRSRDDSRDRYEAYEVYSRDRRRHARFPSVPLSYLPLGARRPRDYDEDDYEDDDDSCSRRPRYGK